MDNPAYIAASRMMAQQRALDVRATNIANVGTPGFKTENVAFADYLVGQRNAATPPGGKMLQMVQDRSTWRDFSQGELTKTDNPLDVALRGDGFFVVDAPQGERYTRAGRFSLSASGQIVDMSGNTVQSAGGGPINIPPATQSITIAGDGTVSTETGPIGKLHVVQFDDQQQLKAEGNSLFTTTQTANDVDQPSVQQGSLEGSNIQAVVELTRLMSEMREFDFASQFADGEAQREQTAIDRIGHRG
jgi:flagellar basal-body rod protein FlgF